MLTGTIAQVGQARDFHNPRARRLWKSKTCNIAVAATIYRVAWKHRLETQRIQATLQLTVRPNGADHQWKEDPHPAFVTAEGSVATAEASLLAGIAAGDAYLNIHTTVIPGGEIRGFLEPASNPASVPEPATILMTGAWMAGINILRRKRTA